MDSFEKAGWLMMGIQTVGLLLTLVGVVQFGWFLMIIPLASWIVGTIIYFLLHSEEILSGEAEHPRNGDKR